MHDRWCPHVPDASAGPPVRGAEMAKKRPRRVCVLGEGRTCGPHAGGGSRRSRARRTRTPTRWKTVATARFHVTCDVGGWRVGPDLPSSWEPVGRRRLGAAASAGSPVVELSSFLGSVQVGPVGLVLV
jgi:hypothetical protein